MMVRSSTESVGTIAMRLRPTALELLVLLAVVGGLTALGVEGLGTHRGERDGLSDAEADIEAGRPRWMSSGKPRAWRSITDRLFKERYGVEPQRLYGCCPTSFQASYGRTYNDCIHRHLAKRFPEFSYNDLDDDARREWEQAQGITQ